MRTQSSLDTIRLHVGAKNFSGVRRAREILKLHARALWHPRPTEQWLRFLNSDPIFKELTRKAPQMLYKIYRPYFSTTQCCAQRVALLIDHYTYIRNAGLAPLVLGATQKAKCITSFAGKTGTQYGIAIRSTEIMYREGELVLQLTRGTELLYSCAFSFFPRLHRQIAIGGLQGGNGPDSARLIREATRDFFGIRPKALLLKLVSAIGHALGYSTMRLVGNCNHAARKARKAGKVYADYDGFWIECGAAMRPDGDFDMPCSAPLEPDLLEVPSHKRSAARARHQYLMSLTDALLAALDKQASQRMVTQECVACAGT